MTNSHAPLPHVPMVTGDDDAQRDALYVGSVEKAFRVLDLFSRTKSSLSLSEIAVQTGMGKSAAQRFCHTLVSLGYLQRDVRSRQLRPAAKLLELAFAYLTSEPIISVAAPHLLQAREKSGHAVNLALPHGTEVIYVTRLTSTGSPMANPPIGGRAPMFCTASGRAFLSALAHADAEKLVTQSNRSKITERTIIDAEQIMALVAVAKADGFATAEHECIVGETTIGAPIFGRGGQVVAAINMCTYGAEWTKERVANELGASLTRTARNISDALSVAPNNY